MKRIVSAVLAATLSLVMFFNSTAKGTWGTRSCKVRRNHLSCLTIPQQVPTPRGESEWERLRYMELMRAGVVLGWSYFGLVHNGTSLSGLLFHHLLFHQYVNLTNESNSTWLCQSTSPYCPQLQDHINVLYQSQLTYNEHESSYNNVSS